jgi:hypothetical protein
MKISVIKNAGNTRKSQMKENTWIQNALFDLSIKTKAASIAIAQAVSRRQPTAAVRFRF